MADSKRLLAIADMLIKNEPAADIGADHALLSIYLVENAFVPHAIIGELGDGPYRRAFQAVQESRVKEKILLRQGDGIQILQKGEVYSVVIAGMGGDKIVEILSYDWDKSGSFRHFVFQPMSKAKVLRRELACRGWPLLEERLIEENGHFYVVIASQPANDPYTLNELELDIGPSILKADSEIKREFLKHYLGKYCRLYASLLQSSDQNNKSLLLEYQRNIKQLEAIVYAGQS